MERRIQIGLFLFIQFCLAWVVLLPGVCGHISSGDSGELALAGSTLGIAHSPGYPVFVLLNNVMGDLLYFGNPAFRQNLVSLFFIVAALLIMGWLFYSLGDHPAFALLPLLLLVSPYIREQAWVTEVFPLTFFWGTILILGMITLSYKKGGLLFMAFLWGLGLAVHQTLIFMFPAMLYYWFQNRRFLPDFSKAALPYIALFFFLGLSVNLYLPFRSLSDPVLDWEDPESWSRFWALVTRARYGFFQLTQGEGEAKGFLSLMSAFSFAKNKALASFGWSGFALLFLGTFYCLSRKDLRGRAIACWIFILVSGPLFFWLANVDRLPAKSTILDRFCLLPLLGSFLMLGFGFISLFHSRTKIYKGILLSALFVVLLEGGIRAVHIIPNEDGPSFPMASSSLLRWDLSLREVGINAFRILPYGATLFSDRADEFEFVVAFLKGAEGKRKDLTFVDCNAGVSKSIYGNDYYHIWGPDRLERREKVEGDILKKNPHKVYYATVDPLMINIFRTTRGFLFKAWRLDQIQEPKGIPWDSFLCWRFTPQTERSKGVVSSVWRLLASDLFEGKFYDETRRMFGLLQTQGGDHRDVQLGYLFHRRGYVYEARAAYQRALRSRIPSEAMYTNLGSLYLYEGRRSDARELFEKGLKYFPQSTDLRLSLSRIYLNEGRWKNVASILRPILDEDPNHPEALNLYLKAKSIDRLAQFRTRSEVLVQKPPEPKPESSTPVVKEDIGSSGDWVVEKGTPSFTDSSEQKDVPTGPRGPIIEGETESQPEELIPTTNNTDVQN